MSEQTKIEWTDHSWNPWIGCTKVSPGCAHCYAADSTPTRVHRANGRELWGKGRPRQRTSAATWKLPLKWNKTWVLEQFAPGLGPAGTLVKAIGDMPEGFRHPTVFPSLCDWLDDEVPIEWLADFLQLIHATPNLDWLLLTKRPENFFPRLERVAGHCGHLGETERKWSDLWMWVFDWIKGQAPANVWVGTSVEDQPRADERIPALLNIQAAGRFLSVEPLLGEMDLRLAAFNGADSLSSLEGIHWVIVGGESGPSARPCNVEWIRGIVRQCAAAGVPCFVKQVGANPVEYDYGIPIGMQKDPVTPGEKRIRHPKGGDPAEWIRDLRVRQFPKEV